MGSSGKPRSNPYRLCDVASTLYGMDSRFFNLDRLIYVKKAVEATHKMSLKEYEALLRIDALGWTYVEEDRLDEAYREITAGLSIAKQIGGNDEKAKQLLALGLAWQARV